MKPKRKPYEGHISKHGRRHRAHYSVRGKPRTESFFTEEEARDFLIRMTHEKRRGRMPLVSNLRLDRLFDLVLKDLRNNGKRSVADARARIDLHLLPFFVGMKVSDFRGSDIEDYKAERLKQNAAPASINRELGILHRGFALALQQELIDFRVHFSRLKERNTKTQTFSNSEYQSFRKHLTNDVAAAVDFQREVGWRMPSEVLTLEWHQIDFDEESVTLPPYSTKDEKPRMFYFTARMREVLQSQRMIVNQMQKEQKKIIPFVFPKANGRSLFDPYHDKEGLRHVKPSNYFRDRWNDACEAAKIKRTTHDLRRTAAVERDNAGLSRTDNMLLGGWSSPAMLDRYLQKRKEDLKAAVAKLDDFRNKTFPKHSQDAESSSGQKSTNH